jgi:hypothetical protein
MDKVRKSYNSLDFPLFLGTHTAFVLIIGKFVKPLKLSFKTGRYIKLDSGGPALPPRHGVRSPRPTLQYILTGQRERFGHVLSRVNSSSCSPWLKAPTSGQQFATCSQKKTGIRLNAQWHSGVRGSNSSPPKSHKLYRYTTYKIYGTVNFWHYVIQDLSWISMAGNTKCATTFSENLLYRILR